jgi:hypothetical protein
MADVRRRIPGKGDKVVKLHRREHRGVNGVHRNGAEYAISRVPDGVLVDADRVEVLRRQAAQNLELARQMYDDFEQFSDEADAADRPDADHPA